MPLSLNTLKDSSTDANRLHVSQPQSASFCHSSVHCGAGRNPGPCNQLWLLSPFLTLVLHCPTLTINREVLNHSHFMMSSLNLLETVYKGFKDLT